MCLKPLSKYPDNSESNASILALEAFINNLNDILQARW